MAGKSLKWILIGIGIAVLAAVAYLAAQWIGPGHAASGRKTVSSGGTTYSETSFSFEPAPERPEGRPAANGPIKKITDDGFIISRIDSVVKYDSSGAAYGDSRDLEKAMNDPANAQEIIVTANTRIYKDASDSTNVEDGGTVQESVELITFDELDQNGYATVWGEKRGDRIVADVIFYKKY